MELINYLLTFVGKNKKSNIILSGGKTPAPIYQTLNSSSDINKKVRFVLSDERRVPITDPSKKFCSSLGKNIRLRIL